MDDSTVAKRRCSRCGIEKLHTSEFFVVDHGRLLRRCLACKGKRATAEHRLWANTDKNGPIMRPGMTPCWIWTASNVNGYGSIMVDGRAMKTHRFSYELAHGRGSIGVFDVLHKCDNPPCLNPDHLFLGTDADNVADMIAKGRENRSGYLLGEDNPVSTLTEDDVRAIRASCLSRGQMQALADRFNVSKATVSRIRAHRIWKHVV